MNIDIVGLLSHIEFVLKTQFELYVAICSFVGLCIGSFLNVVIYRMPLISEHARAFKLKTGANTSGVFSLSRPRSYCLSCSKSISWYENIPVFSYLFLKGRCSGCRSPISFRYPFIEMLTSLIYGVIAALMGYGVEALGLMVFASFMLTAAMIDYDGKEIPFSLGNLFIWSGLLFSLVHRFTTPEGAILGAFACWFSFKIIDSFFSLFFKDGVIRPGHLLIMAGVGAWFGLAETPLIVLLTGVASLVLSALMLLKFFGGKVEFKLPVSLAISIVTVSIFVFDSISLYA